MAAAQVGDELWHQSRGDGREDADVENLREAVACLLDSGCGGGLRIQDGPGVTSEHMSDGGESHAATDVLDQRRPGLALEHGELLGDRGGRIPERLGDRRHAASESEFAQDAEPHQAKLHEAMLM